MAAQCCSVCVVYVVACVYLVLGWSSGGLSATLVTSCSCAFCHLASAPATAHYRLALPPLCAPPSSSLLFSEAEVEWLRAGLPLSMRCGSATSPLPHPCPSETHTLGLAVKMRATPRKTLTHLDARLHAYTDADTSTPTPPSIPRKIKVEKRKGFGIYATSVWQLEGRRHSTK